MGTYLTWRYQDGTVDLRKPQGLGEEGLVPAGRGLCPQEAPPCLFLQWDLVCEQKGLNKATSTFFFAGVLVGAVVYGYLSDRWGEVEGADMEWGGEPSSTNGGMGLPVHRVLTLRDPCAGLGGAACYWWPT